MRRLLSLSTVAIILTGRGAFGYPRGAHRSRIISSASDVDETYDYVVIGGGTAGLTVADRLSEDGGMSVLVIEHGELSMVTHTPDLFEGIIMVLYLDTE